MGTGCKPLSIAPLNISQVLVKTNFVSVFGYLFTKLNVGNVLLKILQLSRKTIVYH